MNLELSTLKMIMANSYAFITLRILPTFVHIIFELLYSKHQVDNYSAITG